MGLLRSVSTRPASALRSPSPAQVEEQEQEPATLTASDSLEVKCSEPFRLMAVPRRPESEDSVVQHVVSVIDRCLAAQLQTAATANSDTPPTYSCIILQSNSRRERDN